MNGLWLNWKLSPDIQQASNKHSLRAQDWLSIAVRPGVIALRSCVPALEVDTTPVVDRKKPESMERRVARAQRREESGKLPGTMPPRKPDRPR